MRGGYLKGLTIATVSVLVFTACPSDDEPADRPVDADRPATEEPAVAMELPEGVTQQDYDEGQRLFTGQGGCAACHGPQATGTQLAPDLTDNRWLNVNEPTMDEIMRVIREGVAEPVEYPAPMPPMGGARLNEEQIHALAAYILALN